MRKAPPEFQWQTHKADLFCKAGFLFASVKSMCSEV